MDTTKLKQVGTLGGEPVFELPTFIDTSIEPEGPRCLGCIFNSLIDTVEELEEFTDGAYEKLERLDDIRIDDGVTQLHVDTEREELLRGLALASEGIVNLKGLIGTAVCALR